MSLGRTLQSVDVARPSAPRLNHTAAILTLRKMRLRTVGTISRPSDSLRRQLLQQRLRLFQIARVAMPNFIALYPVLPDRACDRRLGTDRREPRAAPAYL